jgi:hypothetical protein
VFIENWRISALPPEDPLRHSAFSVGIRDPSQREGGKLESLACNSCSDGDNRTLTNATSVGLVGRKGV